MASPSPDSTEPRSRRRPRLGRRARIALLAVVAVGALAVASIAAPLVWVTLRPLADPADDFESRRGRLVEARVSDPVVEGGSTYHDVTLRSSSGLTVELGLRYPTGVDRPLPVMAMLVGKDTGASATRVVPESDGVVVAAIGYPYQGDLSPKGLEIPFAIPAIQRALLDTAPATRLAIDWLVTRPYVDPEHVELVGVSLGAYLVAAPAALDERVSRVWLIHGGGRAGDTFTHLLPEEIPGGPLRSVLGAWLGWVSADRYIGSERWVGEMAPRPVVVIQARDDDMIPPEAIRALHDALGDPHEIQWMDGGHVLGSRRDVVRELAERVLTAVTR